MKTSSARSLNRLVIVLFFLTAGTIGAILGLRGGMGFKSASEPIFSDTLGSSSAQAVRADFKETEMKAETGAIIKIGTAVPVALTEEDSKSRTREQWEALLAGAPVDLLRKHYYEQLAALEKSSVDERFPVVNSLANGKIEIETLKHAFDAQQSQGKANWIAQTRITMDGKDHPISLVLSMYKDQNLNGAAALASRLKGESGGEVCWQLDIFFLKLTTQRLVSSMACLNSGVRRKGDRYFITQHLNLDQVDRFYHMLAVEIPFRGKLIPVNAGSGSVVELLDAQTRMWKAQGNISWTQIEADEAERYREEFSPGTTD